MDKEALSKRRIVIPTLKFTQCSSGIDLAYSTEGGGE